MIWNFLNVLEKMFWFESWRIGRGLGLEYLEGGEGFKKRFD